MEVIFNLIRHQFSGAFTAFFQILSAKAPEDELNKCPAYGIRNLICGILHDETWQIPETGPGSNDFQQKKEPG
ncbi:MAG: hypothetical protein HFG60_05455 [Lachnospiraceae bacterium]|nr:hypothetical protein [Lachnospiraceae bacterium]